jgi:hypothetical protein
MPWEGVGVNGIAKKNDRIDRINWIEEEHMGSGC